MGRIRTYASDNPTKDVVYERYTNEELVVIEEEILAKADTLPHIKLKPEVVTEERIVEVVREVIVEVPVEKIVERIVEVPVEVIKEVSVDRIVEIPVEVTVEKIVKVMDLTAALEEKKKTEAAEKRIKKLHMAIALTAIAAFIIGALSV